MTHARDYAEVVGRISVAERKAGVHFSDGSDHLPWATDFRPEGPVSKRYINRCIRALARNAGISYLEAATRHRAAQEIWLELATGAKKNDRLTGRWRTKALHEAHIALVDELIAESFKTLASQWCRNCGLHWKRHPNLGSRELPSPQGCERFEPQKGDEVQNVRKHRTRRG